MPSGRKYKPTPRMPSQEDREFIREVVNGEKKPVAFRKAYPDHPKVRRYMDIISGKEEPVDEWERSKLADTIRNLANDKTQAKYINDRLIAFQDSMEVLAGKSILVASELLDNGRSEKVRADLAIEFIRHKVGAPVAKVQVQQEKTVHLTFGTPGGRDDMSDIIEGEVINKGDTHD